MAALEIYYDRQLVGTTNLWSAREHELVLSDREVVLLTGMVIEVGSLSHQGRRVGGVVTEVNDNGRALIRLDSPLT